ncbi:MAG: phosphatase PAP2 family protein [Anaerolineae bacterium]|nr:phosphatase PAP2 family protein [Anaerolineae bacterium]
MSLTSRWRWLPALGAHLGDGLLWFVVGGVLLIWSGDFVRGVTLVALVAVLVSTGVSTVIKYTVRRRRPRELTEFYAVKHDRYSFPSGHATRMAAIAVAVGHFYPALASVGYALATLVAVCRIAVGVHYTSDVIVGLLIGIAGASCVVMAL